jgi:putative spermidine/putrescine transport system substrate-binding protein
MHVATREEGLMKRIAMVSVSVVVLTMALVIGWQGAGQSQTKEFVVAAWGDPYEAGWRKSLVPAFEKAHGVKVVWVQGFSTQTLAKLRAQKDNPQIDIAMMDDGPHRQAVALGLVEKLDRSKLASAKELYDMAFEPNDMGISFGLAVYGLYYNTKAFADNKWAPPTSWTDLFRPELKGKVTVHNIANANGLYLLLALNKIAGGTDTNVDPGFARMKQLAPNVVTFDKFGETPTQIQQGQAVIGTWNIDRVANLAATGVPVQFVYPKEVAWGQKAVITVVKGRPNTDLAHKFVDLMLSAEEQVNTAKFIFYGPVNRMAKLDPETAKSVVYGPEAMARLTVANWEVINQKRPEWTERWNKEVEVR